MLKILFFFGILFISSLAQTQTTTTFQNTGCALFDAQNNCVSCKDRYYMYSYLSLCLPVSPICKDYNTTTGACLTCIDGFSMVQGVCQPNFSMITISKNQANCITFNSNTQLCEKCSTSFVLINGGACSAFIANCDTYANDGSCSRCLVGYSSSMSGNLCNKIQVVVTFDVNCKSNDGIKCTQCMDGYMLTSSNSCVKISPLCTTYNADGTCSVC